MEPLSSCHLFPDAVEEWVREGLFWILTLKGTLVLLPLEEIT